MHKREEILQAFGRFLDVLDELREKCPWDRKQTNSSLRPNTIEECFELSDAIVADDVNNIWGTQINEFLSRDYAPIKNRKYVGKYYKVGIMGHHRVVEFGDEISIKTKEVETYTNTCSVGALNGLSITNTVSHCVGQKTSTSVQCSIGFSRIIKAVLNFLDFASFGAETGTTVEATIGSETSYWEETITTTSVTY